MNKNLFGSDDHEAQLQDLYRRAEEGDDLGVTDPRLAHTFVDDQRLIGQLVSLAARSGPVEPAMGRATLLAVVAEKRNQSQEQKGRIPMGRFLTGRSLALLAAAGIFVGGVATVGASGGVSGAAGNVQDVLTALHVTDRASDNAGAQLNGVDQPAGTGKPGDAGRLTTDAQLGAGAIDCTTTATVTSTSTSTPTAAATTEADQQGDNHQGDQGEHKGRDCGANGHSAIDCTTTATVTLTATDTPTATSTPTASTTAAEGENDNHQGDQDRSSERDCGIKGIPTSNPNHPEATGTCEKGEAVVKTTPAGAEVRVPCQAIGRGESQDARTKTPGAGEGNPEATKTPGAHGENGGRLGPPSEEGSR